MFRSVRAFSISSIKRSSYDQCTRNTISHIHKQYIEKKPISMMTCYDYLTSQMNERAGIDISLVGDSLANTSLGYRDTNELNLDEMLYHIRSVQRGNSQSFLVADMPFGSFETSKEQAATTAIHMVKAGAQAVKIEGGNDEIIQTIKKIISVGIPVMGHLGLTPQKHNAMGGYKLQGSDVESAKRIYQEAHKLQDIGVFSIVIECVPTQLARIITNSLSIPTIGIGAGNYTSGQVLVMADILGMSPQPVPRFAEKYIDFFNLGVDALKRYNDNVKTGVFPSPEHGYKIKRDVLEEIKNSLGS
ncbi:ECM31 [Candida oxycetoniae]|uniref:3-methyl-2-oxobutanoate hydroxymethyltransferase n=1 Tax=Candida oxycetoniae TaxID=497107 RepID=A0AAI9SYA7_9ASCO|nr:ECM31 [Candida oxycetoniae]KAI3405376.2 ECM31 [Candida oxycetoniae]